MGQDVFAEWHIRVRAYMNKFFGETRSALPLSEIWVGLSPSETYFGRGQSPLQILGWPCPPRSCPKFDEGHRTMPIVGRHFFNSPPRDIRRHSDSSNHSDPHSPFGMRNICSSISQNEAEVTGRFGGETGLFPQNQRTADLTTNGLLWPWLSRPAPRDWRDICCGISQVFKAFATFRDSSSRDYYALASVFLCLGLDSVSHKVHHCSPRNVSLLCTLVLWIHITRCKGKRPVTGQLLSYEWYLGRTSFRNLERCGSCHVRRSERVAIAIKGRQKAKFGLVWVYSSDIGNTAPEGHKPLQGQISGKKDALLSLWALCTFGW